jgi:hypothetical protein
MLHLLYALLATTRSSLRPQRELALENLALRQQLAIVQRKTKRPKLTQAVRAFWVALCRLWPDWHNALLIVKPQTVIGCHRKGFTLYWTWKSRRRSGHPPIDAEIRTLMRRIARENPTWGAPRIHGELLMLGFEVAQATVSRYMPVRRRPPSQTWRSFLRNHNVIPDRDKIYGADFVRRVGAMGIEQVLTEPHLEWSRPRSLETP